MNLFRNILTGKNGIDLKTGEQGISDYKGNYMLIKNKEVVGSFMVLSEDDVVHHLWSSFVITRYSDLKTILKKYKLI